MERPYLKFGSWIKSLRESKKLTLKQVCEAIGLQSTQSLSLIENGTNLLQPRHQVKFCKLIGIPLTDMQKQWSRCVWLRDVQMYRRSKKKIVA